MKGKIKKVLISILCLSLIIFCLTSCDKGPRKVNFVVDGEVFATMTVTDNEEVKIPEDPVKDGYTFGGWYMDKNTWKIPFSTKVLSDAPQSNFTNVYCKWIPKTMQAGLIFKTLRVSETGAFAYGKVSNDTKTFSFKNEITAYTPSEFIVSMDIYGEQPIESESVSLDIGDNTVYVLETINGNIVNVFTVTVRRRPIYIVVADPNNGDKTTARKVEEDSFITEPSTPVKLGYTFNKWDYDFSLPITDNTRIKAEYSVNPEMELFEFESTFDTCIINGLKKSVTRLVIPDYVTGIADEAFRDHISIMQVTLGTNVKEIGNLAFSGCNRLVEVINRSDLKINKSSGNGGIGYYSLKIITDDESQFIDKDGYIFYPLNTNYFLVGYIGDDTDLVLPKDINGHNYIINRYAFRNCRNIENVTIQNPITFIGDYTFEGCSSLKSVNIPDSVTYIGNCAFRNCSSLAIVTIPDNVTKIDTSAFENCMSLMHITIGRSVTEIETNGFYNCPKVTEIINKSKLDITPGSSAYGYPLYVISDGESNLINKNDYIFYTYDNVNYLLGYIGNDTDLVLPKSFNDQSYKIADYAFYGYEKLTSVTIPNCVTGIGNYSFRGCSSLETATIPDSVKSIGIGVYYGCISLSDVKLSNNIKTIPDYTFNGCSSLQSISIPNGVTAIGNYAFNWCVSFKNVTFGKNVTDIGKFAFSNCKNFTTITIPDIITKIGAYAFYNCASLTEITLGNGITEIGENAFYNCKSLAMVFYTGTIDDWCEIYFCRDPYKPLKDLSNPLYYAELYIDNELVTGANVTTATRISWGAFSGYKKLTSVTIGDSVQYIGSYAFLNCTSLTKITLGNSVNSISEYAFANCTSLTEITLGNGVTEIWNKAFANCKSLTSVFYTGTIDDWCEIYFCRNLSDPSEFMSNPLRYAENLYIDNKVVTEANITTATKISQFAFRGYKKLTSVTIGDSVQYIGEYTFANCPSLTSVTLGSGVTEIGEDAFMDCDALTSVYYAGTIDDWCKICFCDFSSNPLCYAENFYIDNKLVTEAYVTAATEISQYAFSEYKKLTFVTIGDSVQYIGKDAFYNCSSLTNVTLGKGITEIGNGAFENCLNLTEVINGSKLVVEKGSYENGRIGYYAVSIITNGKSNIVNKNGYLFITDTDNTCYLIGYTGNDTELILPDNFNNRSYKIRKHAFRNHTLITSVSIPEGVTDIEEWSFHNCSSLKKVTIHDGATNIGAYAFYNCSSLLSIKIPDSVKTIGAYAFYNCSSLTNVDISDGVTVIGESAFQDCNSLADITIPSSVKTIGADTFYNCSSLKKVTIPDGATSIGTCAFYNCSSLLSINVPDSVIAIEKSAFQGCKSLTSINIPDGITFINDFTFYECYSLTNITLPNNVKIIGAYAFSDCKSIKNIIIPDSVTNIYSGAFERCNSLIDVTVPNSVTILSTYSFEDCISLKSITFLGKITVIGSYAFSNCESLTNITIPNSVTTIGAYAFNGCKSLLSITIPESVTVIEEKTFSNCTALTSVNLPSGMESIGTRAFDNCSSLENITIPDSVTKLGYKSFNNCESLKAVYINQSINSFYLLTKKTVVFFDENPILRVFYCKDGIYVF